MIKKEYYFWLSRIIKTIIIILVLLWILLVTISILFPTTIFLQSSTHFLAIISNNPDVGSSVEWCPKKPSPETLTNGDTVLAYKCRTFGWVPFHINTPWP